VRLVPTYGSVNVQHCCMYYNPMNEWGQSIIIPLLLINLTTIIGQRPHREDNISSFYVNLLLQRKYETMCTIIYGTFYKSKHMAIVVLKIYAQQPSHWPTVNVTVSLNFHIGQKGKFSCMYNLKVCHLSLSSSKM